ncbi:hypothetical protein [Pseudomonas mohnii]
MVLNFKAKTANSGASTFSPNGLTAKAVVGLGQAALQGGEIVANGMCNVIYSATLDKWVLYESSGGAQQVAAATKSLHSVQAAQIQAGTGLYVAGTGGANVYAAAYTPVITALTDGMQLRFKALTANTGASTFSPNGLTAKAIVGLAQAPLQGGEIVAAGTCTVVYSLALDQWVLTSCSGGDLQVSPATQSQHAVQLGQAQSMFSSIVGSMRNAKMNIATAAASGTFTADEIIVESALGGQAYRLANFSKVINLATTGAGGMDTGVAPASGFVSIYAIYNPATQTAALLACNQTTSSGNVYTGANMPSGYTASALVSAWGTTAGSLLSIGSQVDRQINVALATILSTTTAQTSTAVNISSIVPIATREISGIFQSSGNATGTTHTVGLAAATGVVGTRSSGGTSYAAGASVQTAYGGLSLGTVQTVYFTSTVAGGTLSQAAAYLSAYTI